MKNSLILIKVLIFVKFFKSHKSFISFFERFSNINYDSTYLETEL